MQAVEVDAEPEPTDIERLRVRNDGQGWSLIVDDLATPAWTVSTKAKAVAAAEAIAADCEAVLVIETRNGRAQKRLDFTKEG